MVSITASLRTVTYTPVNAAGPFPIPFPMFDGVGEDLFVTLDGVEVVDWAFTGTQQNGFYGAPNTWVDGSITFADPISGELIIQGRRSPRRQAQFAEGRGIPARDHNTELNILTAIAQEMSRDLGGVSSRAILVKAGQTAPVLDVAAMLGKALGINIDGEFAALPPGLGTINADSILDATAIGKAVIRAATTGAAQDAIGGQTAGKAVFTAATPNAAAAAIGAGGDGTPTNAGGGLAILKQATLAAIIALLPAFIASGASHAKGLVPDPGSVAGISRFLREDSTWASVSGSVYYNAVTDGTCDNTGVTDTTVAIEAAITAATAAGKTCYFPAGTYDLGSGTVNITVANARIVCEGRRTIFRRATNVDAVAIKVEATATGMRWEGGRLSYTPAGHTISGNHTGFWLEADNSEVKGLRVDGRFYIAVLLTSAKSVLFRDCLAKGAVNRGFYASYPFVSGEVNVVFDSCTADGAEADGGATPYTNYGFNSNGFGTGTAQGFRYINCLSCYQTFHGFATSERITGQQYIGCQAHSITGPGFLIQDANGFSGQRVILSGCKAVACTSGFWSLNSFYVAIVGCTAQACSFAGITLSGGQYCTVTGCICENNSGGGIILNNSTQTVAGCDVTGNVCVANTGIGMTFGAGTTNSVYGCNIALANSGGNYSIAGTGHVGSGNL